MRVLTEVVSADFERLASFDSFEFLEQLTDDEIIEMFHRGGESSWPDGIIAIWAKDYYDEVDEVLEYCRAHGTQFIVAVAQDDLLDYAIRVRDMRETLCAAGYCLA